MVLSKRRVLLLARPLKIIFYCREISIEEKVEKAWRPFVLGHILILIKPDKATPFDTMAHSRQMARSPFVTLRSLAGCQQPGNAARYIYLQRRYRGSMRLQRILLLKACQQEYW